MAQVELRAHDQELGTEAGRQPFRVAVSDFRAGKNVLEKK